VAGTPPTPVTVCRIGAPAPTGPLARVSRIRAGGSGWYSPRGDATRGGVVVVVVAGTVVDVVVVLAGGVVVVVDGAVITTELLGSHAVDAGWLLTSPL
jgi:hypothetical protein